MTGGRVIPLEDVEGLVVVTSTVAAQALVQSKGNVENALARLESQRGNVQVMAEEWSLDVVELAQQAITEAGKAEA